MTPSTERIPARARRAEALARFEQVTEVPLLVMALLMVPLLVAPAVWRLSPAAASAVSALDSLIWAAFAIEYVVRLVLTTQRWRFIRREWPDLLIVVLPFLRPMRIVRSARALRLLRLSRLTAVFAAVGRGTRRLLTRHKLHYVLLTTVAVGLGAALLVLELERGAGGSITSIGDALWWAAATMTTVGYGDALPATTAGRAVGFVLMLTGIALFGALTANLAAFMVDRDEDDDRSAGADRLATIERQLAELTEEIRRLRAA